MQEAGVLRPVLRETDRAKLVFSDEALFLLSGKVKSPRRWCLGLSAPSLSHWAWTGLRDVTVRGEDFKLTLPCSWRLRSSEMYRIGIARCSTSYHITWNRCHCAK